MNLWKLRKQQECIYLIDLLFVLSPPTVAFTSDDDFFQPPTALSICLDNDFLSSSSFSAWKNKLWNYNENKDCTHITLTAVSMYVAW